MSDLLWLADPSQLKNTLVGSGGKQGYLWLSPYDACLSYMYIVCIVDSMQWKKGVQLNNIQEIEILTWEDVGEAVLHSVER